MDSMARRHVTNRLLSAQRRRAAAVEELALFVDQARRGHEGSWHNAATTIALGAAAKAEMDAYQTALDADDASRAPSPT